jgi:hypothetical protein
LPRKLAARSTRVWQARHRITYGVLDGNPHLSGFRNEGRLPMGRWQVGAGHHIQRFERWFGLPEDPYPRGEVYLSPAEQEWARAERARWPDGPTCCSATA